MRPMPTFQTMENPAQPSPVTPFPATAIHEVIRNSTMREAGESSNGDYELFKKFMEMRKEERSKVQNSTDWEGITLRDGAMADSESDRSEEAPRRRRTYSQKRKRRSSGKTSEDVREFIEARRREKPADAREILDARRREGLAVRMKIRSPFTDEINNTPIPDGLKAPRVKAYDGTGDPDDHVANFRWAIKMIPMDPKLWCLYFVGTLEGAAR
jgi:hypothetical protein